MKHGFLWTHGFTRKPQENHKKQVVGCVSLPSAGMVSAGEGTVSLGLTCTVPV